MIQRPEAMILDRRRFLLAELRRLISAKAKRTKASVSLVTAGAPRDLRHFGNGQPPVSAAVELFQASEGDMGHIHVEAHADRVGGDEIINLAALEHGDLRIAGRRRQCPHHDGGAALEAAQHLGQRIDLLGREGDDGGAWGQAAELGGARIAQCRKAWAANDFRFRQQLADQRP
jgi:hypothetical protein